MSKRGYFRLSRDVFDDYLFDGDKYSRRDAWIWLLSAASYQPHKMLHKGDIVIVEKGEVPTSYRKLSERWGWAINTVRGFVAILEKDGKIHTRTDTGFLIISICNYDDFKVSDNFTDTVADTHTDTVPDTVADTHTDTKINKGNKREIKEKEYISVEFESFWEIYPKKIAKKSAYAKFVAARKKTDFEIIMDGVRQYLMCQKVIDGFICNPETWLSQERWTDDYTDEKRGNHEKAIRHNAAVGSARDAVPNKATNLADGFQAIIDARNKQHGIGAGEIDVTPVDQRLLVISKLPD